MPSTVNRQRRPAPNECVSSLKHAVDASVHRFVFDEFASCDLLNANLYLLLEPLAMGKELGNGLLHQLIGSPTGLNGELVKLGLLVLG
jgi:hypothetical protein